MRLCVLVLAFVLAACGDDPLAALRLQQVELAQEIEEKTAIIRALASSPSDIEFFKKMARTDPRHDEQMFESMLVYKQKHKDGSFVLPAQNEQDRREQDAWARSRMRAIHAMRRLWEVQESLKTVEREIAALGEKP